MMKKFFALVLCVLMALTFSAVAEEPAGTAWHVVIDEIEFTYNGETIAFNPSIEGVIGTTDTGYWGECAVLLNGEQTLTVQGTLGDDDLSLTFGGAKDVLHITDLAKILDEDFDVQMDLPSTAAMIYSTFEDTSWIDQMIPSLTESGVTVETRGANDYAFSYAADGEGFKVHVAWDKVSVSPVDFSDKNVVTFSFDSTDLPEVDLLIRTSGEERLSNFLLYQLAYAEFVFDPILWPDFDAEALDRDIAIFQKRQRRFGGR